MLMFTERDDMATRLQEAHMSFPSGWQSPAFFLSRIPCPPGWEPAYFNRIPFTSGWQFPAHFLNWTHRSRQVCSFPPLFKTAEIVRMKFAISRLFLKT
jgi:hypothetical protein